MNHNVTHTHLGLLVLFILSIGLYVPKMNAADANGAQGKGRRNGLTQEQKDQFKQQREADRAAFKAQIQAEREKFKESVKPEREAMREKIKEARKTRPVDKALLHDLVNQHLNMVLAEKTSWRAIVDKLIADHRAQKDAQIAERIKNLPEERQSKILAKIQTHRQNADAKRAERRAAEDQKIKDRHQRWQERIDALGNGKGKK